MNTRTVVLILTLGILYIFMVLFISIRHPEQVNPVIPITFGILLIGGAIAGVYLSKYDQKLKDTFRLIKILFASQAFVFGLWMLGSILIMPISGYAGFMLLENNYFFVFFLIGSLLFSPFVAKKLK